MESSEEKRTMAELDSSPDKFEYCLAKLAGFNASPSPHSDGGVTKAVRQNGKQYGGWKTMPYILGNETFERLASMGMTANLTVFLLTQFHIDPVEASNILSIWFGFNNFAPLCGAFISDSYLGKFSTIAYASFASLMGMITMTLVAYLPQLHPPPCTKTIPIQCQSATKLHLGILVMGLGFLSIGGGGIKPCSLPFGVDQFDSNSHEGRKSISSFFNWYYTTFTIVLIIALTLVVYIQDTVSWTWGFAIPTMLMFSAIIMFFVGSKLYVYMEPEGSLFSSMFHVAAAAYKKRNVGFPAEGGGDGAYHQFYDPILSTGTVAKILPLTDNFRFLNKAALIMEGEINPDGSNANPWSLCSVQQVEELKCLLKVIPVWASGIICFTAVLQQSTFTVAQAMKMDRHMSPHFQIPAGSLIVISMITLGLWIPIYDRLIVPRLRKVTRIQGGITFLQRMGIGLVFSVLAMIAAGLVERVRRDSAVKHARPDQLAPMTVFWLAPQLVLMGFAEAFNLIGQMEFYNREFPENLGSVANSLFYLGLAIGSYVSTAIVNLVHKTTGGSGHAGWLPKNINEGRVENLYYVIAGLGVLNLGYFVLVSQCYHYKTKMQIDEEDDGKSCFQTEKEVVEP